MSRAYYSNSAFDFARTDDNTVLGHLTRGSPFAVEPTQSAAWQQEIVLLKQACAAWVGAAHVYLEYSIPRLGKRIDAVLIVSGCVLVLEFKVGEMEFTRQALDQVCDYALDLKNFHETSHHETVIPVVICTAARPQPIRLTESSAQDGLFEPVKIGPDQILDVMRIADQVSRAGPAISAREWDAGRYQPTPTIIEAALALYARHGVAEISRSDAEAKNLAATTRAIEGIIQRCQGGAQPKAICFVTGVPGAGKTLVGLNIATQHADKNALHSVFLSGNGPLVAVLREALARDKVRREAERGVRISKKAASSEVNAFIQNVHHFRDEYLQDARPPYDHIAVFDEAQRAWDLPKTADFMKRKKNRPDFHMSESEFLISCLDRHQDWAVIVCLVGGGQEINTGEAGISEWLRSIEKSFEDWTVYVSPNLREDEYGASALIEHLESKGIVQLEPDLHLGVSMRSFRAGNVSALVRDVLNIERHGASSFLSDVLPTYPIVLTRNLAHAKSWVRAKARGSERYGLLVSSQAQRLKPLAIDVRAPTDPIRWFLDGKDDTRSSYYLEDAATEFSVQGLEVDWSCVVWDGDFRYHADGWRHFSFVGDRWNHIHKDDRKAFLKNAYRVLLTRARQGMVIVVPAGDPADPTRHPDIYDPTFQYLSDLGIPVLR